MQATILYILVYATFNVCGAAIVKLQLKQTKLVAWQDWLSLFFNGYFIVAALFIIFSAMAMFKALSGSQFSFVIPIATGINFLLTIVVGYFLFQDRLSIASYIGIFFIIAGILMLSVNSQSHA
jgi:multidrug transporter EmrE-like cation transporter